MYSGEFCVEDVLGARCHHDASGNMLWEVLCSWKGYSDRTWEPREAIEAATQGKVRQNLTREVNREMERMNSNGVHLVHDVGIDDAYVELAVVRGSAIFLLDDAMNFGSEERLLL